MTTTAARIATRANALAILAALALTFLGTLAVGALALDRLDAVSASASAPRGMVAAPVCVNGKPARGPLCVVTTRDGDRAILYADTAEVTPLGAAEPVYVAAEDVRTLDDVARDADAAVRDALIRARVAFTPAGECAAFTPAAPGALAFCANAPLDGSQVEDRTGRR